MRCIFCLKHRPSSLEHVFPLALGGDVTTDRVCEKCNSTLGSQVDSALSNFFPIRARRAKLGLAGNSGEIPGLFEMLEGESALVGHEGARVRTKFDRITGKLDHRLLYQVAEIVTPDGKKARQIRLDARDKGQLPTIIQRERKRRGLSALSSEQLAMAARNYTISNIANPVLRVNPVVSFAFLRHAMFKIAYELAFLWLGERYIDDPLAAELRTAILASDPASTDGIAGFVGTARECTAFNHWTPHEAHHLAHMAVVAEQVIVSVRIFDIYAAAIPVSREAVRYFERVADFAKLRFLAIDSVSRVTISTSFADESRRLAALMTASRRLPPFPDPI
jgi:hypothetical protein